MTVIDNQKFNHYYFYFSFIILFYKIATEAVENIRTIMSLTREKAFEQMYEETLQTQHR